MRQLLFLLLTFTSFVHAERFEKTGGILEIYSSINASDDTSSHLALVFIEDFKTAGNCYKTSSTAGHVAIVLKNNDQGKVQLSMLLSAYMAGSKVEIRLDDSSINRDSNNYCYLQHVRLNKLF